jgi:subtilisin family serine protease
MKNSKMLFIVSAGNSDNRLINIDIDKKPVYPASYKLPHAICVASVGESGRLSAFSNKGGDTVDIAAPGENIISTSINNEYKTFSGCSAAVPFVTGVAALLFAMDDNATPEDVKKAIIDNVSRNEFLEGKIKSSGIIDGGAAVAAFRARQLKE